LSKKKNYDRFIHFSSFSLFLSFRIICRFKLGTVVADMLHIVGIYPHDTKLLKKYSKGGTGGGNGSPVPGGE
jgi:hypothetical protein